MIGKVLNETSRIDENGQRIRSRCDIIIVYFDFSQSEISHSEEALTTIPPESISLKTIYHITYIYHCIGFIRT